MPGTRPGARGFLGFGRESCGACHYGDVPDKDYRIYINDHLIIAVSIQMVGGQVVSFVVRLTDARGGEERDLARYDTAHGWPHLDILTRSGNLKSKHWMKAGTIDDALTQAIIDFKENHDRYRNDI